MITDKIDILVEVDGYIETCVDLALQLGLSVSLLNTIVKNHEAVDRSYIRCGTFSK
jgi:hypothetical protein